MLPFEIALYFVSDPFHTYTKPCFLTSTRKRIFVDAFSPKICGNKRVSLGDKEGVKLFFQTLIFVQTCFFCFHYLTRSTKSPVLNDEHWLKLLCVPFMYRLPIPDHWKRRDHCRSSRLALPWKNSENLHKLCSSQNRFFIQRSVHRGKRITTTKLLNLVSASSVEKYVIPEAMLLFD